MELIVNSVIIQASRSRKGAWIEIPTSCRSVSRQEVAPARERGLKSKKGVILYVISWVAPARERGLKSFDDNTPIHELKVAPARERGLKLR